MTRGCAQAFILALLLGAAFGQTCDTSFIDAMDGSDLFFFREGLGLAGVEDKLPNPGDVSVTLLAPTNGAWTRFFWNQGFFLGSLGSLGDKLTSVVTFHVLPTALSPDAITQPIWEGESQTLLSLLAGGQYPLRYGRLGPEDDNQILFQGTFDETVAGVSRAIQVCNSWIYVVDEVLLPAWDVDGVPTVTLPDTSNLFPTTLSPSPEPEQPAPEPEPEAPGGCNVTWQEVAKEQQGLSLLAGVLGQEQVASALPGPGEANTLFAPTDAAFFNMLATLNLTIDKALSLGDRLVGLLQYHAVPGVVPPDQLGTEPSLPTLLGDSYRIGVEKDADGKVTLSGILPNNKASIVRELTVCNSQVYVIDSVLVPAASADELPVAGAQPAPSPTVSEPQPPAGETVEGLASGAGYLANCTVQLGLPSGPNSTTNSTGGFLLPCEGDGCAEGLWLVRLPGGQGEVCVDAATGLPVLYSLQAATPNPGSGPVSVNPVSTLQSVLYQSSNDQDWQALAGVLAEKLGVSSPSALSQGDLLQAATSGDADALAVQTAAAQLQTLVSIGSSTLLGALAPEDQGTLAPDTFSYALYAALGDELLGDAAPAVLDLTNASVVERVLVAASRAPLQQAPENSTRPEVDVVAKAAAGPIAALNQLAAEALAETDAGSQQPTRLLAALAKIVAVAQGEVAPAAREMAAGGKPVYEFTSSYSEEGLVRLIQNVELPTSAWGSDVGAEAKGKAAP